MFRISRSFISPPYWREALRRDPLDSRCNNALGLWHLRRGEFAEAEALFSRAIKRLTHRNANPYDGEAYYNLGLCLRFRSNLCSSRREEALTSSAVDRNSHGRTLAAARILEESYAAFYKATWNQAWAAASYHALAEIDCLRKDWNAAVDHVERSLRLDTDNLRARDLKVLILRKLGRHSEAASLLQETLRLDLLDWWARDLAGQKLTCDLQTCLDIAHDYARSGFDAEAVELLRTAGRGSKPALFEGFAPAALPGQRKNVATVVSLHAEDGRGEGEHGVRQPVATSHALPTQSLGALPLVHYTLGWLEAKRGNKTESLKHFQRASRLSPDYCFPARLEEIAILETAIQPNSVDARAPYYLGNLLYDRRRHEEAIRLWERSVKLDADFSIAWRNLGIAYLNIRHQPAKARAAYERAVQANPGDARLFYERDQLWKRLGEKPERRLRELSKRLDLVEKRDDLSIELCALYNQTGRHQEAARSVGNRKFQPWEGGEGGPLGQHVRSQLALGRAAFAKRDFAAARAHFELALTSPQNLSEAKHLLANQSDIHFWLASACAAAGDRHSARRYWSAAASFKGDFQEMTVRAFSEMTYYSALSLEKLGERPRARRLFRDLQAYGRKLQNQVAKIDYFATSLPSMLLFEDDLQFRQQTAALFLQAQGQLGLGKKTAAKGLLKTVLRRDPNHAMAADFLKDLTP